MASSTSTRAQTMKHSKRRGGSRVLGHTKRKTPGKAGKLSSPPILAVMSETGERGPLLVWFVRVRTHHTDFCGTWIVGAAGSPGSPIKLAPLAASKPNGSSPLPNARPRARSASITSLSTPRTPGGTLIGGAGSPGLGGAGARYATQVASAAVFSLGVTPPLLHAHTHTVHPRNCKQSVICVASCPRRVPRCWALGPLRCLQSGQSRIASPRCRPSLAVPRCASSATKPSTPLA